MQGRGGKLVFIGDNAAGEVCSSIAGPFIFFSAEGYFSELYYSIYLLDSPCIGPGKRKDI